MSDSIKRYRVYLRWVSIGGFNYPTIKFAEDDNGPIVKYSDHLKSREWVSVDEVIAELKKQTEEIGLREYCRRHQLDAGNLSNILNENKSLTQQVANSVGYDLETVCKARPLPPPPQEEG